MLLTLRTLPTMLLGNLNHGLDEAGCDEAGRGALAGPVFAAAVILPTGYTPPGLNDSKKLSESKRTKLRYEIELNALDWSVACCDNQEIEQINILQASFLAMHRAIQKLSVRPAFLLIDGNHFLKYQQVPHRCIAGGDGKYASIAAASILAKTHRDEYMKEIHVEFPEYKWLKNKAYGTKDHRKAIVRYGLSPYHRKSFCTNALQLSIDF
jgi:ribonuclease HII